MLRIAVCWSGLTRDLVNVVQHNKTMFDKIETTADLKFDHFCQFWNSDNKFPYTIDASIDKNLINDSIPAEHLDSRLKIVDILEPKLTITTDFKSMSPSVISFLNMNTSKDYPLTRYYGFFDTEIIDTSTFQTIFEFRKWAGVHDIYVNVINRLAQFYAFEKSVLLAKEYSLAENLDYDVVIRIRYDTALLPDNHFKNYLSKTIEQIHRCWLNDCIVVEDFKKGLNLKTLDYDINMKTKKTIDTCHGVADMIMIGSSTQIYRLTDNLSENVSRAITYMCETNPNLDNLKEFPSAEILWFDELCKKQIVCVSSNTNHVMLCYNEFNVLNDLNEVIFNKNRPLNVLPDIDFCWPDYFVNAYLKSKLI